MRRVSTACSWVQIAPHWSPPHCGNPPVPPPAVQSGGVPRRGETRCIAVAADVRRGLSVVPRHLHRSGLSPTATMHEDFCFRVSQTPAASRSLCKLHMPGRRPSAEPKQMERGYSRKGRGLKEGGKRRRLSAVRSRQSRRDEVRYNSRWAALRHPGTRSVSFFSPLFF